MFEMSTSGLWLFAAEAEGIIRELGGIRGHFNANLHTDRTIISLVFKSD